MNQDQNTAIRGIIVGIASLVGIFFPEYGPKALEAAGVLYAITAAAKPFLPPKVQGGL